MARGTGLQGDRATQSVGTPGKHCSDHEGGAPTIHVPLPGAANNRPISDGSKWVNQIGIALSELLGGARGNIVRREASDWVAYAAKIARQFLVGDGTDVVSRAIETADLPDPIALITATELTIAAGSITATQTYHAVDTEADAATDDLDTIAGGTLNDLLVIRAAHDDRTVVVKHGTGNIWTIGEADISLEDTEDHLLLIYDGTKWCTLGDGGGAGGAGDAADLTYTPAVDADWDGDADPGNADDAFDQLAERVTDVEEWAGTPLAVTTVEVAGWEELDRDTLVGNQASIDFQNISQDYEDLWLTVRSRTDKASTVDWLNIALNNDAVDANYRRGSHYAGSAHGSSAGDFRIVISCPAATSPAGYFGIGEIHIPRYSESELHMLYSHSYTRRNGANIFTQREGLQWETAAAVNRITLTPNTGPNLVAGTEVILYGLRKRDVVTAVSGSVIALLSTITDIDATAAATTTLYTVPAGRTFIPNHVVIRVTAYTAGAKDQDVVASFGSVVPTYDDYINSVTYAVTASGVFLRDSIEDTFVVTHGAALEFSLIIEIASNADVETWSVDLFGYCL